MEREWTWPSGNARGVLLVMPLLWQSLVGQVIHACIIEITVSPYLSNSVIAFFVASLLVLFFNVGIPNELKGCLFFIQVHMALFPNQSINHCMILIFFSCWQVVGFVYESTDGVSWDFHLSRVFGFSFYLPLCPYPGYSALGTAAYGLILSLLAIATLVIYIIRYCSSESIIQLLSLCYTINTNIVGPQCSFQSCFESQKLIRGNLVAEYHHLQVHSRYMLQSPSLSKGIRKNHCWRVCKSVSVSLNFAPSKWDLCRYTIMTGLFSVSARAISLSLLLLYSWGSWLFFSSLSSFSSSVSEHSR